MRICLFTNLRLSLVVLLVGGAPAAGLKVDGEKGLVFEP